MNCMSCGSPENAEHLSSCPVLKVLHRMALALRMHPDPARFASVNLEFEKIPGGPLLGTGAEMGLGESVVCGGLTVKAMTANFPAVGHIPGLVFQFHKAEGGVLQPIVFMPESESDFMATKMLIARAVNTARNAAHEARG